MMVLPDYEGVPGFAPGTEPEDHGPERRREPERHDCAVRLLERLEHYGGDTWDAAMVWFITRVPRVS